MPTRKQWIYYGLDANIGSDIDPKSLATQGFRYAQTILVFLVYVELITSN